jgi:aspartate racemase
MKTIGMIGGIGPESTIEYYRLINAAYAEHITDGSYPAMIINSIDLQKLRKMAEANERIEMTEYLVSEIHKLARAGADFGFLAANTPHMVFDEVRRQSPIPLVSIVEATCEAAKAMGLQKLGLFGTRMTMQGRFYSDVFSREGITLAVPDEHDQAYIHHMYFNELVKGTVLLETRQRLMKIVDRLKERESIQGLILGGTELSLIFRDATVCDIPVLDTTKIHAKAIVEEALAV